MYGLVLTTAGAEEIEAAWHKDEVVTVTHALIGDGGDGSLPGNADEMAAMTALKGEFGSEPFSRGEHSEGFISGEVVIVCGKYPGRILREVGLVSQSGTLIAYGLYPETFLPSQTDAVIKEVILTLVLGLTHARNVVLELDPSRVIITQEAGDKRYLRQEKNLADVRDKDESVDNLGLRPTVEKAENAVQRGGDTMHGKLTLPETSSFGVNTNNGLGGNSLALGDAGTGLRQSGTGMLDICADGQTVFRFRDSVLQSNRAINAEGRLTPSDYGNFDERYKRKEEGVQDVRLGSYQKMDSTGSNLAPSGFVSVGGYVYGEWDNSADGWYIRPLQKLINGTWYNVASM